MTLRVGIKLVLEFGSNLNSFEGADKPILSLKACMPSLGVCYELRTESIQMIFTKICMKYVCLSHIVQVKLNLQNLVVSFNI